MKTNTPVKRNTCFAIISAIEDDLRAFIRNECQTLNKSDVLPTDVRDSAMKRWKIDNQSSAQEYVLDDLELLDYADFMDIKKTIDKALRPEKRIIDADIELLTKKFEILGPIRNRVCHTRPLEVEDFATCFDTAKYLLAFRSIEFSSLKQTVDILDSNPTYALQLQIPTFWFLGNDVNHNLPLPEFEETGFIGRKSDRQQVLRHLKGHTNIITIVGEGGVGKTALALRCLYDLLDDPERPFNVIVWVSLKTQTLTATGVVSIRDAIADTLGLLRSVATNLGTADAGNLDTRELISEIAHYLSSTNVLVAIDNLETLAGDETLYSLLLEIPKNSKVLLTSRLALGKLELPYNLDSLDRKEATALMRCFANVLSLDFIGKAENKVLDKYCQALFDNPLLIKWFVESIARGSDPNPLLTHNVGKFQDALDFCCSSLLSMLNDAENKVVNILVAARSPLTWIQLSHLYSTIEPQSKTDIDYALGLLHNSCIVKREARSSGGYHYRLSEPVEAYISTKSPPSQNVFLNVKNTLQDLRKRAQDEKGKQAAHKYDVFSIRANDQDEQIIAIDLRKALNEVDPRKNNANITEAREHLESAKRLRINHAETYRVAGLVESAVREYFRANEAFEKAVEYDPESSVVRYTYAQFLIRELEQFDDALGHLEKALEKDPNDGTLRAMKALVLTRLSRYGEAAELYEDILGSLVSMDEVPRRWRISTYDQAAECYRRWAERNIWEKDYEDKFKQHIDRAFDILKSAISAGDYDDRTRRTVGKILYEAVNQAIRYDDISYAEEIKNVINALGLNQRIPHDTRTSKMLLSVKNKWPDLHQVIIKLFEDQIQGGDGVGLARERVSNIGEQREGTVVNVNVTYGFIDIQERDNLYFHKDSLLIKQHWALVQKDTCVSVVIGTNDKGLCGTKVAILAPNGKPLHDNIYTEALNDAKTNNRKTILAIVWALFETDYCDGNIDEPTLINKLDDTFEKTTLPNEMQETAKREIQSIAGKCIEIDELIETLSQRPIDDIGTIERNILRFGIYEIKFRKEFADRYALNEAIDIAKLLLDENAGKFVNGVLGSLIDSNEINNSEEQQTGGVVYKRDGEGVQFAMVQESGTGIWTLSKGKLRSQEDPEDGFKRVIREEIGIEGVKVIKEIGENSYTTNQYQGPSRGERIRGKKITKNVTYFLGEAAEGSTLCLEVKPGLSNAKWFTAEDIKKRKLHKDLRNMICESVDEVMMKYSTKRTGRIWHWIRRMLHLRQSY